MRKKLVAGLSEIGLHHTLFFKRCNVTLNHVRGALRIAPVLWYILALWCCRYNRFICGALRDNLRYCIHTGDFLSSSKVHTFFYFPDSATMCNISPASGQGNVKTPPRLDLMLRSAYPLKYCRCNCYQLIHMAKIHRQPLTTARWLIEVTNDQVPYLHSI